MEPIDAAFEKFKAFVENVKDPKYWDSIQSEEDVRMKIINPVFTDILGWPVSEIHCESSAGKQFIDYRGTINGLNRLIIEAKKEARDLGINEDHAARFFQLKGAVFHTEAAREGIDQAIRYCGHKNVELACLTNGRQWAVFRGRGKDGMDTMDNLACVFGSLESVVAKFKGFYELLSYESVKENTYRAVFREAEGQPVRQKTVKAAARPLDSREMVKTDKLYSDLEKIMHTFFRDLDPLQDAEARKACFVTTSESDAAEKGLERISEDLRDKVQELDTADSTELTEIIRRVHEMQRNELVLLVGTKGAGKTTFITSARKFRTLSIITMHWRNDEFRIVVRFGVRRASIHGGSHGNQVARRPPAVRRGFGGASPAGPSRVGNGNVTGGHRGHAGRVPGNSFQVVFGIPAGRIGGPAA